MSTMKRVPVRALREIANAVSAERSMSYATTEVARAALVVSLRDRLHIDDKLARQVAQVQEANPMSTSVGVGPGASVVHNAGPVFRAAYLIRAAQRTATADDSDMQGDAEHRYLRQHQAAQMARELGAMRMDAARAAYGRTLGWYSRGDGRVTADCRAANGKNFDPTHPPAIGLPGLGPHVGCRCVPGPPHEGAAFMPGAPPTEPPLPNTTVKEPAHLPGDKAIAAAAAWARVIELVSGDTRPFSTSKDSNWVAKAGGLPDRVRAIARAVRRKHPEWTLSHCIAVAINAVKYSAATGDSKLPGRQNERASTVAAHGAAAARWAAMKASAHAHTAGAAPEVLLGTYRMADGRTGHGYMVRELATVPGSVPVRCAGDGPRLTVNAMQAAVAAVPHAKDPAKARARCIALAKRKGMTRVLPASWASAVK